MSKPVVIVGAGAIGLSIGWMLSRSGTDVLVLDRDRAGRQTSWLSAGMLAPETELGFEQEALYEFGRESMNRWPEFVKNLEADSGQHVDYRTEGILHVASDRDEAEALQRQYQFQLAQGLDVTWMSGAEAREIEPFLAPRLPAAVYSKSDHQVDNRLLVEALAVAFQKKGGVLRENAEVRAIEATQGGVGLVLGEGEKISAEKVILAAGAWSRAIDGIERALRPAVRPVKGQMIQLRMEPPFELKHVVWGRRAYLTPKSSGRLLLGATVEERGFDTTVTAGGLYTLLEAGWRLVPGIYDLEVTETWAGLRPGSRDNEPILGDAGVPGVIYATGHFRNGILQIPITASEISKMILTGETSAWLKPFSPQRFATQSTT